ncbi:MAG: hypothetical protein J6I79_05980 [Paludibacteraceae bacterium]|nr:hypothetical protein [Paludibacteraceae bacterium]
MAICIAGCHKEHDDYTTKVEITMVAPDSLEIERMQGTVTLTNLSNGQSYSVSEFKGSKVEVEVFRGPYAIQSEGTLMYQTKPTKETGICGFRCNSNYEEVLDHPSYISMKLLLLTDQ